MKKITKLSLTLIPMTAILAIGFNNCARMDFSGGSADQSSLAPATQGTTVSASSSNSSSSSSGSPNPYALLSAEQTLASMLKVTGVNTATPAILTEYNLRYGGLAAGSGLDLANSPLMLGSTSLAGEICNTMITREAGLNAADRAFFNDVNFGMGPSAVSDEAFAKSVRGMARSFWGRNENSSELLLFAEFKKEFVNLLDVNARNTGASTTSLWTGVCSAMLSSIDTLSY